MSQENQGFTHLDTTGNAKMVNVSRKPITDRLACASVVCKMQLATAEAVRQDQISKGNVLQVARLAAIGASKRTDELIPLCHSIGLDGVDVRFEWPEPRSLKILVSVQANARTGVEMEAMVAASIAALTVYDMCKAIDRTMVVTDLQLESKSGGTRGDFRRQAADTNRP